MARLANPKNRRAEALNVMMKKTWFNYYDMAKELNNLNIHRVREFLESEWGVSFEARRKKFVNRFGRVSSMKEFRIKTDKKTLTAVYNKINGK